MNLLDSAIGKQSRALAVYAGARDALPMVMALIPFALAVGAAMASTNVPAFTGWSSSWLIVGGSAQLVAVQMLDSGAHAALVVAMALVVNIRHLLYSASLAPYAQSWPRKWRLLGAYFLADPIYALAIVRYERVNEQPLQRLQYYAGVAAVLWSGWLLLTGIGVLLTGVLPAALPLTFAVPLGFLLLLLPMLKDRPGYAAALTGGAVALATTGLPLGLNVLAGGTAGAMAGAYIGSRHA
ncbi:AzlC family ABC transporter permease [Acrocarpospora catenulata]|uniref:AzlC family ABC transporter permease n=1 Tax=Acrocarpospora catenulata TaxID=2836182 RepID=UPI001BD99E35|nr:AzlC family ABC transporter permease [Acrocarpospora catenulata]